MKIIVLDIPTELPACFDHDMVLTCAQASVWFLANLGVAIPGYHLDSTSSFCDYEVKDARYDLSREIREAGFLAILRSAG